MTENVLNTIINGDCRKELKKLEPVLNIPQHFNKKISITRLVTYFNERNFEYFKHGLVNLSADLSFNHERLERQFKLVFQEGFLTQIAFYSSFFLCFEIVEVY